MVPELPREYSNSFSLLLKTVFLIRLMTLTIDYLRSFRLNGFAVFDFVMTGIAAKILQVYVFKDTSLLVVFIGLMILAIGLHKYLGIKTRLNTLLGL